MIRRPPRSTLSSSSAASDVYKRQGQVRGQPGRRRTKVSREVTLGESALLEGAAQGRSDLLTLPGLDVHGPILSDMITEAWVRTCITSSVRGAGRGPGWLLRPEDQHSAWSGRWPSWAGLRPRSTRR